MCSNVWTFLATKCVHSYPLITRYVYLPLGIFGILGILINTHISFLSAHFEICYPKENVVFLKTHKCAGSSIQNILMRYGHSNNLTFVLPKQGNYLGHPAPFSQTMMASPRLPAYNILAHHTRFDYREIAAVMPKNSVYITILRDPVQVFESAYSYYALGTVYGGDFHSFLLKAPKMNKEYMHKRVRRKFGSNQMMFDLGADPEIFNSEAAIIKYIEELDSWFDLVLIADRMDESLILLKHLMCWDLDDVVTFKLNARDPKFKSSLNEREVKVLREFNHADVLLYNHFLKKFEKAVISFGRKRMAVETQQLRTRIQELYNFCVKGAQRHTKPTSKTKYYFNPKVMVFQGNTDRNSTCKWMILEELLFTDILRERQKININGTVGLLPVHSEFLKQSRLQRHS